MGNLSSTRDTPRILIIAGSDSGGGAGIQADIKTVTMLGGHAMTAITAITAQSTLGVDAVQLVSPEMVRAQIDAVASDIGFDAVKIGMLGSPVIAAAVADWLDTVDAPVVFDPVMVASSGATLADPATIAGFERLIRRATVSTPNSDELAVLAGGHVGSDLGIFEAAAGLAERHGTAILATGTRIAGGRTYTLTPEGRTPERPTEDYLYDRLFVSDPDTGFAEWEWPGEIIDTQHDHGTGCTLASAIAVGLAQGKPLHAAVARARQFVRLALRDAPGLGGGHGPMGHAQVRLDLGPGPRLNQVTLPSQSGEADIAFYRTLGLRQIVATDHGYARFEAPGGATLSLEQGAVPAVFLECEDLDAEVARLTAAGIAFDHMPVEQSWLWREARLTDPSGNLIVLFQADENRRYPPWRLP